MLAGVVTLLFALPNFSKGDLKDIAKPYLGVYECKEATLNGKDFLDEYEYIHLELKPYGKFVDHLCEKGKKKKEVSGKYVYDREKGEFRVSGAGNIFKRKFVLQEGVLQVYLQLGKKNLLLKFEQK